MTIFRSIQDTWTSEVEGITFTLGPLTQPAIEGRIWGLLHEQTPGSYAEAMVRTLEEGGLRGWSGEAAPPWPGSAKAAVKLLATRVAVELGAEVWMRSNLKEKDSD